MNSVSSSKCTPKILNFYQFLRLSDISNFFIYKNGETSDESIFSRIWEVVDFFSFPKK